MSNRVCVTAVALGIGVAAAQPAAAAEGLIEGASATLQARNYYFSRDFSDIVGPNQQSKAEEWAQGFILDFRSGYTPGPIGFGLDGWLNEHVANWVAVICQLIAYVLKLLFFVFFFVWVRWTLPRFRYDQVMKLGWMVFFELAVINIFITAAILYFVK